MPFEAERIRAIDLTKVQRYMEPVEDGMDGSAIDQLDNLTAEMRNDYVNSTAQPPSNKFKLSWRSIFSYDSDNQEALEDWQERNHEISYQRCAVIRSVRWISVELWDPPIFDGTGD